MKKFLVLVLVAALAFAIAAPAMAIVGFTDKSPDSTKTISKFVFDVSGWEATAQDGTTVTMRDDGSLTTNSNLVWKEISGYVVKDTLVKALIQWRMPAQEDTNFDMIDYANAKLAITWDNLTPFSLGLTADEAARAEFASWGWIDDDSQTEEDNLLDIEAKFNDTNTKLEVDLAEAAAICTAGDIDGDQKECYGEITMTFIVDSSKDASVTCKFTSGQEADVDDATGVFFGGKNNHSFFAVLDDDATVAGLDGTPDVFQVYRVTDWTETQADMDFVGDGIAPTVGGTTAYDGITYELGSYVTFVRDGDKLNDMFFTYDGNLAETGSAFVVEEPYRISYSTQGCLAFDGACEHTDSFTEDDEVLYTQMSKQFNEIMKAVGFSFAAYNNITWGYVTEDDVTALATQLTAKTTYTYKGYSATITVADAAATIPPTGDVSGFGFALIALAVVAAAVVGLKKVRA